MFPSMLWAILLPLLSHCSGVSSQPTLTQPPSESVALGKTVRLSARLSSGYESYVVSWYQQKVGQAPQLLLDTNNQRPSGIPDRFSGSKSGLDRYLTITGVLSEDEATYYCGLDYGRGSSLVYIFGGGTTLSVQGGSPLPPSVILYPPSQEEMEKKNKATLVCLLSNFHPPAFTLSWEADGTSITTGVETTKATKVNDKYVASSYLTLSPSEWKSRGSYTCKVTHERVDYVKSVSHSQCP